MGEEVNCIQRQLQEQNHYRGPIDGIYGGGTETAVRAFQRSEDLAIDGIVGPNTWQELFDEDEVSPPSILDEPLYYRSLALTGSFGNQ
ncbi:MAG: peptidoglycan-binding domain-containing protein [Balneolaceae bacterium]|nr:peptidoglycan-binding domain-containing protein [Balneolaceae bacterium]